MTDTGAKGLALALIDHGRVRYVHAFGVFDVALAQIPAKGFGQAGLDRFDVNKAAEGDYEDALGFGANAGLDRKVILKERGDAKAQAWKAYPTAAATASARPSAKLLEAVRKCMPQPPPPNQ